MVASSTVTCMGWIMARYSFVFGGLAIVALALASPAQSKTQPLAAAPPPKIFTDVVQCRSITDSAERLACFDRSVGALATAQASRDIYVADKEAMREARRGLFGFSLPKIKIFGDEDMAEEVDRIETTIASVREGQKGYIFTLKDGALWKQTDGAYIDRPKAGAKIRIRRASLGSFFGSVEGQPGFRIERINN
ncbi:MAG TPA: hypothetical protein VGR05_02825 [Sphingomicrobium sp.]|nr:hypothetical protein [Sphingomicrobium sp.]